VNSSYTLGSVPISTTVQCTVPNRARPAQVRDQVRVWTA